MSQLPAREVIPLRLPDLGPGEQPGAGFVRRAVSSILGIVLACASVAVLASFLVRMDLTMRVQGVLEPAVLWPVRVAMAGVLREVVVQTGDTVRAGDVIARLDRIALESSRSQLEAQYRAVEIERAQAAASLPLEQRRLLERQLQAEARLAVTRAALVQRMVEYRVGSNVDSMLQSHRAGRHVALDLSVGEVRSVEAEIRLARAESALIDLRRLDWDRHAAQLEQLQARLREVEERMAATDVRAPTGGVILTDHIEQLVGSHLSEGSLLLELAQLDAWRVVLSVPERDVHRIQRGDRVNIEIQAFDQADRPRLRGEVVQVGVDPTPHPSGGMYRVEVAIGADQLLEVGTDRLRRGYSVQAHIVGRSGRLIHLVWGYLVNKVDRGR